jgi:DNA adenine methylase
MIDLPIKTYYGGKSGSGVYQAIINQIPYHKVYLELFLGAGSIMRHKKPAEILNIGCELDPELVNIWEIVFKPLPNFTILSKSGLEALHEAYFSLERMIYDKVFNKIQLNFLPYEVFVYADPPYLLTSRKCQRTKYRFEFTEQDHITLLAKANQTPFNMAISCYPNDLYETYLKGWRKIEFKSQTRRGSATEVLYMNYPKPDRLHDYSYLGNDFRQRERIRKKLNRHVEGLKRLPIYERMAIIEAIANIK